MSSHRQGAEAISLKGKGAGGYNDFKSLSVSRLAGVMVSVERELEKKRANEALMVERLPGMSHGSLEPSFHGAQFAQSVERNNVIF